MNITRRSIIFAASLMLAISSIVVGTSRVEASSRYFTVSGTVTKINAKERTLLVSDRTQNKFYLVSMPKGSTLKITWGRSMTMREPGFSDVNKKDRVEIRCYRNDSEHLARLDDGSSAIVLTAASAK
jgi:hypothetical protein